MTERHVIVGSSVGLHARPASLFVQAAAKAPVPVLIAKQGGEPVDARSILSVLGLDARGGDTKIMAAVMAAGMTPPIACALASVVRKQLFTPAERTAGEAAWLLGLSFITEGAIPFAAGDPLRVIPSLMAGSAVTGALSMAFGATSLAPHGGIWVIGLIGKPLLWAAAIVAGVGVSAVCLIALKSLRHTAPASSAVSVPGTTRVPVGA